MDDLLTNPILDNLASKVVNKYGEEFDKEIEAKTHLDFSVFNKDVFERNLTYLLSALIEANKTQSKEDIKTVLQHYSAYMFAVSCFLDEVNKLDY